MLIGHPFQPSRIFKRPKVAEPINSVSPHRVAVPSVRQALTLRPGGRTPDSGRPVPAGDIQLYGLPIVGLREGRPLDTPPLPEDIGPQSGNRKVGLCGAHFSEACARYPEVRRSVAIRPSA